MPILELLGLQKDRRLGTLLLEKSETKEKRISCNVSFDELEDYIDEKYFEF